MAGVGLYPSGDLNALMMSSAELQQEVDRQLWNWSRDGVFEDPELELATNQAFEQVVARLVGMGNIEQNTSDKYEWRQRFRDTFGEVFDISPGARGSSGQKQEHLNRLAGVFGLPEPTTKAESMHLHDLAVSAVARAQEHIDQTEVALGIEPSYVPTGKWGQKTQQERRTGLDEDGNPLAPYPIGPDPTSSDPTGPVPTTATATTDALPAALSELGLSSAQIGEIMGSLPSAGEGAPQPGWNLADYYNQAPSYLNLQLAQVAGNMSVMPGEVALYNQENQTALTQSLYDFTVTQALDSLGMPQLEAALDFGEINNKIENLALAAQADGSKLSLEAVRNTYDEAIIEALNTAGVPTQQAELFIAKIGAELDTIDSEVGATIAENETKTLDAQQRGELIVALTKAGYTDAQAQSILSGIAAETAETDLVAGTSTQQAEVLRLLREAGLDEAQAQSILSGIAAETAETDLAAGTSTQQAEVLRLLREAGLDDAQAQSILSGIAAETAETDLSKLQSDREAALIRGLTDAGYTELQIEEALTKSRNYLKTADKTGDVELARLKEQEALHSHRTPVLADYFASANKINPNTWANEAQAGVAQEFNTARKTLRQDITRSGAAMGADRASALEADMATRQAAATAAAKTTARRKADETRHQRLSDAVQGAR